ncbi:hypothetical protein RRG08_060933 [Elysia crispata]|uniref:Uncharacterized protein n=1 Tax=Elysia crispata TaxID=231223 RepID=A0AAE1AWQ9_9GAST|nr:hypothetical protein RRG08_060933 [Elysia crispata]
MCVTRRIKGREGEQTRNASGSKRKGGSLRPTSWQRGGKTVKRRTDCGRGAGRMSPLRHARIIRLESKTMPSVGSWLIPSLEIHHLSLRSLHVGDSTHYSHIVYLVFADSCASIQLT